MGYASVAGELHRDDAVLQLRDLVAWGKSIEHVNSQSACDGLISETLFRLDYPWPIAQPVRMTRPSVVVHTTVNRI